MEDLDARPLFFWRLFFRHILSSCKDAGAVQEVFAKVAAVRKADPKLVSSLLLFIRRSVGPWLAAQDAGGKIEGGEAGPGGARLDELMRRVRVAEKVLASAGSGVAVKV